jgi:hypothetical protein
MKCCVKTSPKRKLFYDRWLVGQSVLVSDHHLGPAINFSFQFHCNYLDSCGFLIMWHPLWPKDMSVIYLSDCYWALPAQSLSGPNSTELVTLIYSIIWDSQNLEGQVPVFMSTREGWPVYTIRIGYPFHRLLRHAGLLWRYYKPHTLLIWFIFWWKASFFVSFIFYRVWDSHGGIYGCRHLVGYSAV